jgi:hypothetical protein
MYLFSRQKVYGPPSVRVSGSTILVHVNVVVQDAADLGVTVSYTTGADRENIKLIIEVPQSNEVIAW